MTIIRWKMQPAREFNGTTPYVSGERKNGYIPLTNVARFEDHYRIDMAVPGRNKNDFIINLEKDTLTISWSKKEEQNNDFTGRFLKREFDINAFERHFTLPEITDKERISARYENGILSVNIPFEKEMKLSRKINVN
jgi:HSP20 family protein